MNNELYHYGVPGMRWGHRKSGTAKQRSKLKLSKGKKVAIGATVAGAALVAIGAKPIAKFAGNVRAGFTITKALIGSM